MGRILISASARQDLDDLWGYVAIDRFRPEAADRLIDQIDEALKLILTQPTMGELVDNLRANTRRFVVRSTYLLFYDEVADGIRLLRVLHGAQLIRPEDLQAPKQ